MAQLRKVFSVSDSPDVPRENVGNTRDPGCGILVTLDSLACMVAMPASPNSPPSTRINPKKEQFNSPAYLQSSIQIVLPLHGKLPGKMPINVLK